MAKCRCGRSLAPLVAAMHAGSWAPSCCMRPSRRPLRCCCCSSRACWPSALCCTAVAERGCVQHKHHGCCWLVLLPVHLQRLLCGAPGPAQLARRARAHRRGRCQPQPQPQGLSLSPHRRPRRCMTPCDSKRTPKWACACFAAPITNLARGQHHEECTS